MPRHGDAITFGISDRSAASYFRDARCGQQLFYKALRGVRIFDDFTLPALNERSFCGQRDPKFRPLIQSFKRGRISEFNDCAFVSCFVDQMCFLPDAVPANRGQVEAW